MRVNHSFVETQTEGDITVVKEIVYTLDLGGNFKFVNAEGQRLSGYSRDELSRMNVSDIVSRQLAGVVSQQIDRMVMQPVGAVYEIEIITKDRRCVVLETSIHLVTRNGHPIEIHGIALPPVGAFGNVRPRCLDHNFALDLSVPSRLTSAVRFHLE